MRLIFRFLITALLKKIAKMIVGRKRKKRK